MNEIIIKQKGKQLFTTSLDVAEKFGKQHKNVLQAVSNLECSDEFNGLNFEPVKYTDEKGESRPMINMTKDGFVFLAMGFRGKKAAEWKEKYIAAFNAMEQALSNQNNLSWRDQRSQGKVARLEVTDTIKSFVTYAEQQGSKNAAFYYKHITNATYKALFMVQHNSSKSFRDMLNTMQLSFLTTAEFIAAKAIEDGMGKGLHYKEIYKLAKDRIEAVSSAMPKTKVISIQKSIC